MLLKELKEKLVIEGARSRLQELEAEREALLKILNLPTSTNHQKAERVLVTAKSIKAIKENALSAAVSNKRSAWTPARLKKFRATMKRKYGSPKDWPSTKAVRTGVKHGISN
jgi:hypothetical protein